MEMQRFQELKQITTPQALLDWFDILTKTLCAGMQENTKKENRVESTMAQRYIEQHFSENITLSALA